MRDTPRFATWILRRFTTTDECVAGDLLEQYCRGGRSRHWYWRQVLSAIGHDVIRDLRLQPVRMPLAIAVGFLVVWCGNVVLFPLLNLPEWLFVTGLAKAPFTSGVILPTALRAFPVLAAWKALIYAGSGWITMRSTRASHPSSPLVYAWCVLGANLIALVQCLGRYTIAQLTVDLLVLYPFAALLGGVVASKNRASVPGVES